MPRTPHTCLLLLLGVGLTLPAAPARTAKPPLRVAQAGRAAAAPGQGALAAAAPADTRVKIIPKPVPCVPCPCECPEVRSPGAPSAPTAAVGTPGVTTPAPGTLPVEPGVREPEPPAGPEPGTTPPPGVGPGGPKPAPRDRVVRTEEPRRPVTPPPPPQPKVGTIAGEVVVRDRGGKEKSDRSDVVVYIKDMPRKYAALKRVRKMAQRDKSFTPRFMAVTRGSAVEFPNEDKLFHNVFSLSEGNTFDLGLYRAGMSRSFTFEKSGLVDVYCNIHPNMWAQVLVLDNPFYAVTSKDGQYEIPKVPPGTYKLVAWVSGGDPVTRQVTVTAGGKVDMRFELKEGSTSKPHMNKFNQPYGRYK